MNTRFADSSLAITPASSRPRRASRIALATLGLISLFIATAPIATAQSTPQQKPGLEFFVTSGALVSTGVQRDVVKSGNLSAAQLSYRITPAFVLTSTVGWARSRDVATPGDPKLDVFTYDLGAEVRAPRWHGGSFNFRPFAGVGAGARSYDYRGKDTDATHNLAAYGSVGGEIGVWRLRLRVEARDYVTEFRPLDGAGPAATRNDVVMLIGLSFVKP